MAIERKTVVDQIEITRSGEMRVRIGLLLVEDGVEIDCRWHRTVVPPEVSPDEQFASVNSHLESMGKEPVSAADIEQVTEYHDLFKEIAARVDVGAEAVKVK